GVPGGRRPRRAGRHGHLPRPVRTGPGRRRTVGVPAPAGHRTGRRRRRSGPPASARDRSRGVLPMTSAAAGTEASPVPFGVRLRAAMDAHGPLCAGLDPHPNLLAAWGLPDDASGLAAFSELAVRALAGQVAALKPQSALYERHGSAGIAVLEATIRQA